jgi:hypothetical protein
MPTCTARQGVCSHVVVSSYRNTQPFASATISLTSTARGGPNSRQRKLPTNRGPDWPSELPERRHQARSGLPDEKRRARCPVAARCPRMPPFLAHVPRLARRCTLVTVWTPSRAVLVATAGGR